MAFVVVIRLLIYLRRSPCEPWLPCYFCAFGQELPDAPSFSSTDQTRTADMAFWVSTGAYGASIAGDAVTRSLWLGRTSTCPRDNVAIGLHGTRAVSPRAALNMAGEFALASIASYEFKKHNLHIGKLRLWELPFVSRTYAHSHDIINNIAACR